MEQKFGCHDSGQKRKTFVFMPTGSLGSREISDYDFLLYFNFSIIKSEKKYFKKLQFWCWTEFFVHFLAFFTQN